MKNSLDNDLYRKKDLIDWIDKVITAYKDLQYLYRDSKDYTEIIATLSAVADHVNKMKPYDGDETKKGLIWVTDGKIKL